MVDDALSCKEHGTGLGERPVQLIRIRPVNPAGRPVADPFPARFRIRGIGDDGIIQIDKYRDGQVQN